METLRSSSGTEDEESKDQTPEEVDQ